MRKTIIISAITIIVVGAALAGLGYWIVYGDNTPDYAGTRSVKLPPEASFEVIVDSLSNAGILKRADTFSLMADVTGWGEQLKPGHYVIESGVSNYDLLDTIRKGLQTPVKLTIPPGSRPDVVAAAVAKQMYFEPGDFLTALNDSALAAELQTDTLHLFSYMLPETYFVYWLSDARSVVKKIKGEFDAFFIEPMHNEIAKANLTVEDVLSIASIVEWETNHDEEKPEIAGVYLNRLNQRWRLDADPTVQYALLQIEGKRRRLFFADYKIDHPYNTYTYRGLPPGPVTNPSPSSIQAVVYPKEHNFMFFVANGDGSHTFTRTLSEHRRASRAFHNLMRERRRQQALEEAQQNQADSPS